jgi:hypothetical protein
MPDPYRQAIGRYGATKSWGQTVDRPARTRNARAKSPGSIDYWLDRLDPERFAEATDAQRLDAAESLRRAHFRRMALRSAKARRRGGDPDAPAA